MGWLLIPFRNIPSWHFLPFFVAIFVLPSIAVTVNSGATTTFWFLSIPALIFFWSKKLKLFKLERLLLFGFVSLFIATGLSLINAEDLLDSLGSYERYVRFLLFVPLYLFVRKYQLELAPIFSWGLLLGCLVIGLVAIYQYHVLNMPQPMGARQINRFGFAAVTFFLLLTLQVIFRWRAKWILLAATTVSIVIIYGITLNNTRGAMLCVFPFMLLLMFQFRNDFDRKKILLFLLVSVGILALFLHPRSPVAQYYYMGFEQLSLFVQDPMQNYKNSWGVRFLLMYHGIVIFLQSPILGTGLGDYRQDIESMMNAGQLLVNDPLMLQGAHNIFIHILAETGLVGFFVFVLFVFILPIYIYSYFLMKYQSNPKISLYALSGLTIMICHFTFGMVNTWLTNNAISIFLILNLVFISNIFILSEKTEPT
ncbi:MAG: O-antigen ligase family protein [Pseudomonadota bacterium]